MFTLVDAPEEDDDGDEAETTVGIASFPDSIGCTVPFDKVDFLVGEGCEAEAPDVGPEIGTGSGRSPVCCACFSARLRVSSGRPYM